MTDRLNVKLRGSGQIINLSRMPDEFVEILHEAISESTDPLSLLATWAYMFAGLSIDEIRERFIVQEGNRVKFVSREYVRQKIKIFYEDIHRRYTERYGDTPLSTLYYNKYSHIYDLSGNREGRNRQTKEEYIDESNTIDKEAGEDKEQYEEKRYEPEPEEEI